MKMTSECLSTPTPFQVASHGTSLPSKTLPRCSIQLVLCSDPPSRPMLPQARPRINTTDTN